MAAGCTIPFFASFAKHWGDGTATHAHANLNVRGMCPLLTTLMMLRPIRLRRRWDDAQDSTCERTLGPTTGCGRTWNAEQSKKRKGRGRQEHKALSLRCLLHCAASVSHHTPPSLSPRSLRFKVARRATGPRGHACFAVRAGEPSLPPPPWRYAHTHACISIYIHACLCMRANNK